MTSGNSWLDVALLLATAISGWLLRHFGPKPTPTPSPTPVDPNAPSPLPTPVQPNTPNAPTPNPWLALLLSLLQAVLAKKTPTEANKLVGKLVDVVREEEEEAEKVSK